MTRTKYLYSCLRYVHDIATGEFVIVGIAVFSPSNDYLGFRMRPNLGRLGEVFDRDRISNFRKLIRVVRDRADKVAATFTQSLMQDLRTISLEDILRDLFPKDDSALQWSPIESGITSDLDATTDRLYQRYCGKYDHQRVHRGKTDQEAMSSLKRKLVDRRIDSYFQEKIIHGESDEVKFPFAWKNGIWHCIEALSFDLSAAEQIRDKARKRAGELVGISDAHEKFSVHYVITRPAQVELSAAFDKAIQLLTKSPVDDVSIYFEGQETAFLDDLKTRVSTHQ